MSVKAPEEPLAVDVSFNDHQMIVELEDGRELRVPLEWFATQRDARPAQRAKWRLVGGGEGIHSPELDEDLSVAGLLTQKRAWAKPGVRKPSSSVSSRGIRELGSDVRNAVGRTDTRNVSRYPVLTLPLASCSGESMTRQQVWRVRAAVAKHPARAG